MHTKPLSSTRTATSIQTKDRCKKEPKDNTDSFNSFPSHLAFQIKSGSVFPCLKCVKIVAGWK